VHVAVKVVPDVVHNNYAFDLEWPDEYVKLPPREVLVAAPYIHGYFFNHHCAPTFTANVIFLGDSLFQVASFFACQSLPQCYFFSDWHHQRDKVLDLLGFHPSIVTYALSLYGDLIGASSMYQHTVSVHLRLGYAAEPDVGSLRWRSFPTNSWFEHVMSTQFFPSITVFLVFSDNMPKARELLKPLIQRGLNIEFIDENIITSMYIMSQCRHHILTSSTASFWGAYLDRFARRLR
jgi:hypothetical protein